MNRRTFLALGAAAGLSRGQSPGDTKGAAIDFLYQALELLWEKSTPDQVLTAISKIRSCLDLDANNGDAHYYRARCLQRLNQKSQFPLRDRDLDDAKRYGSEALVQQRNPFKLAVPQLYNRDQAVGSKWALVIGISKFQNVDWLGFAARDAESFAEVLKDPSIGRFPSDQVIQLTNEQATTSNIKASLNEISRKAQPQDVVVFYISTHGSPRDVDLRQVSYLYTYDTVAKTHDQVFGTALPMVDVSQIISTRCRAQRTVVLFDTCHSGAGVNAQSLTTAEFNRLTAGAGRYVISSCADQERSYEEGGHGFFTSSVLDALKERGGCIRIKDLFERVQKEVSSRAKSVGKNQHPVMAKSDDATEIVLGAESGKKSEGCLAASWLRAPFQYHQ